MHILNKTEIIGYHCDFAFFSIFALVASKGLLKNIVFVKHRSDFAETFVQKIFLYHLKTLLVSKLFIKFWITFDKIFDLIFDNIHVIRDIRHVKKNAELSILLHQRHSVLGFSKIQLDLKDHFFSSFIVDHHHEFSGCFEFSSIIELMFNELIYFLGQSKKMRIIRHLGNI